MKILSTLVLAGFLAMSVPVYAEVKKEPEVKTVCLDVQGKDGKPVIDKKTGKVKQNCVKVKVRKKFEGTAIEDAKKK
jgi:hypothetical protein